MTEAIEVVGTIPAEPAEIYAAWLDAELHAEMTGGAEADSDPVVGGRFTAWDGYISGTHLELDEPARIVQAWRTTAFEADDPDSRLEVRLEAVADGTRVTIVHTEIPAGQGEDYRQGWQEYYLEPMTGYFSGRAVTS